MIGAGGLPPLSTFVPLSIPSPSTGVWDVFGFPLRAYALCIMAGIIIAMVLSVRRWRARGGDSEDLETVVVVAVPFGIIGARIYHVITDYQLYFGPGRDPIDALKIWNGGLGIWGAVALGALGAWLVCRRRGIRFLAVADTMAPGLAIAQGIGRLGNWFNQELFGRPTTLPWGLEIDPQYRPSGYESFETFHPTFGYELLWVFGVAAVLIWAERRFRLGYGKVFALYVVLYTAGRFWIEALRIDQVNEIGGFRLNNYTSVIIFVLALAWFVWLARRRPGREESVYTDPEKAAAVAAKSDPASAEPDPTLVEPVETTDSAEPDSTLGEPDSEPVETTDSAEPDTAEDAESEPARKGSVESDS